MKKIFQILVVCLLIGLWSTSFAGPQPYTISLAPSGTTTVASGTSVMITPSGATRIYIADSESGAFVIQLKGVDNLAVSTGQISAGGNYSGTTGTLRYRESVQDTQQHWDKATAVDIWTGVALSGTTLRQVKIWPEAMGYIYFEWITGVTPFRLADFIFKPLD